MNPSLEILVHISGPSRGPDDTRYRKEAQGLLGFEAVSRHEILRLQEQGSESREDGAQQTIVQRMAVTSVQAPEGLLDAVPPENAKGSTRDAVNASSPDASCSVAPVSSTQDASKSGATFSRIATWPTPQMLIERTPALPRRHTTPTVISPASGRSCHRRTRSDSWKTPPSVIPDSQPTQSSINRSQILSSPCLRRPFAPSFSPFSTHEDDLRSRKRQCVQDTSATRSPPREGTGLDEPQVNSSSTDGPYEAFPSPSPLQPAPPLVIHSPRPYSSNAHFETHLTPSLQTLSTQLPLQKYFKPIYIRVPGKLERGHWLIPIQSWAEDLKNRFWEFLVRFVGEGRAGWGVWCSREFQGETQLTGSSKENKDPTSREEVVRMYCWGEIVGELWLLLFIASERQIKGVGARWYDASQESVVQMA